jgi:hypothetical protein
LCFPRGWSNQGLDDQEPVMGLVIVGIEAQCLAKELGGRVILVAARRQLAEQPVGKAALRIEADDVAKVALGIEITAQRDPGTRADQQQRHALRLILQRIRAHRDDPRKMPGLEQL